MWSLQVCYADWVQDCPASSSHKSDAGSLFTLGAPAKVDSKACSGNLHAQLGQYHKCYIPVCSYANGPCCSAATPSASFLSAVSMQNCKANILSNVKQQEVISFSPSLPHSARHTSQQNVSMRHNAASTAHSWIISGLCFNGLEHADCVQQQQCKFSCISWRLISLHQVSIGICKQISHIAFGWCRLNMRTVQTAVANCPRYLWSGLLGERDCGLYFCNGRFSNDVSTSVVTHMYYIT